MHLFFDFGSDLNFVSNDCVSLRLCQTDWILNLLCQTDWILNLLCPLRKEVGLYYSKKYPGKLKGLNEERISVSAKLA